MVQVLRDWGRGLLAAFVGTLILLSSASAKGPANVCRLLVLYVASKDVPSMAAIERGTKDTLRSRVPYRLGFSSEHVSDGRQLRQWGRHEERGPPGSMARHHGPSFRQRHRERRALGLVIGFLGLVLGCGVWRERRKRLRAEERRVTLARIEKRIAELAASFAALPTDRVHAEIRRSLPSVAEHLGVERVDLLQWSEHHRRLRATHAWMAEGIPSRPLVLGVASSSRMRERLSRADVLRASSPDEFPAVLGEDSETYRHYGVRSFALIPLSAGGFTLGALVLSTFRAGRSWPDDLIALLQILGQAYANLLERTANEIATQRSNIVTEVVLASMSAPVAVLDRQSTVLLVNDAWHQAVNDTGAPLLVGVAPGSSYLDVCRAAVEGDSRIPRSFPEDLQSLLAGRRTALVVEHAYLTPTGEQWYELLAEPLPGGTGGAVISHRDLTNRKQIEAEAHRRYQEAERVAQMLALGELAAALAHELNQPLAAILANSQAAQRFLATDTPELTEIREILADISSEDRRAVGILSRIRAMIRGSVPDLFPLDLNEVIQDAVDPMRGDARSHQVQIELQLDPGQPWVKGDAVQLQQALANLMRNAVQAMDATPREQRRLTIRSCRADVRTVEVAVRDNGDGIPVERLSQIFKPFYTTKSSGMGVGLTVTRSIVELHGGRLSAANNTDRGATFQFTLPILEEGSSCIQNQPP